MSHITPLCDFEMWVGFQLYNTLLSLYFTEQIAELSLLPDCIMKLSRGLILLLLIIFIIESRAVRCKKGLTRCGVWACCNLNVHNCHIPDNDAQRGACINKRRSEITTISPD